MNVRAALVPTLAPVLAVALLSGCAAGQETTSTGASAAASTGPTTPAAPEVRTVAVSYAGGAVTGTSGREEVPVGEPVVLRISSDVAEEVHVHGYDLEAAVPVGGSVDIRLTASIPGVFEVELHQSGKVLFQLRVA